MYLTMDGSFDVVSAADVKEGFLCPICMSDLGNVSQLHQHFEDRHADEDKNTLQKFREILGKNKIIGKILNKDDEDGSLSALASAVGVEAKSLFGSSSGEHADCDPVTGVRSRGLGRWGKVTASVDHTGDFKRERRKKLDRNKSVNQVLTRLERLMTDLPRDPAGRRAHEQAVVAWIEADHVKLCPTCARGFNVARRKHHCRLCGCVMCGDCSVAVSFDLARRVLNPASVARFGGDEEGTNGDKADSQQQQSKSLLSMGRKLVGSNENLNALADLMEQKMAADPQFRSCKLCLSIVEGQEKRFGAELEASDSEIVGLFKFLGELEEEGTKQAAMYVTAVESLKSGEEEHNVGDVKRQRMKLALIAEKIAGVGKSIRDGAAEQQPETPLRMQLRRNVYQDAVNFVKSNLVSLPDAPTEDEFDDLKSRRVREAEDRVEEERREARVAKIRAERTKSSIVTSQGKLYIILFQNRK